MTKKLTVQISSLLCIVTLAAFGWYQYLNYSILPSYEKKLSVMVQSRSKEINSYLNAQQDNAIQLSQDETVINTLLASSAKNDTHNQQGLLAIINTQQEGMGFKNIILINTLGSVVFSTTKTNIIGENINNKLNSSLGSAYERVVMTLTSDFSRFNYNELLQEPALFITIPIIKEKKLIGTLHYQLNEEKIYLITHQYIGLEKTGEVVLATKDGEYALFVSPTRNDPDLAFRKVPLSTNNPLANQASVLGKEGAGIAIDYRNKHVVCAWEFIPKLDWGMTIQIDLDEVLEPAQKIYMLFMLLLLICLMSICITLYANWSAILSNLHRINRSYPCNKIPSHVKNPLLLLMLLFLFFTIRTSIRCQLKQSSAIKTAEQHAIEMTSKNADSIQTLLSKIAFVSQSIADDLRTNYLKKDDIETRIKRDLTENSMIDAMHVILIPDGDKKAKNVELISTNRASKDGTENSTQTPDISSIITTKWYKQALEKESTWIINTAQTEYTRPSAVYARTFFDNNKQLLGVIAVTCSLEPIIRTVEYSGIGQTGYSIIMTQDGSFIFHPTQTLVASGTTLLQYAQSQGNEELASIAQQATEGKPVLASYASPITKERNSIYTYPISINNWIIGSIFSESEVSVSPQKIRHYHFWILILATITLFLLLALFWQHQYITTTVYAVIANIILLFALIIAWHIIQKTATINRETRTIITDQSNLNKFLNDLNDEANRKHETPPISIPCGILLYSLSFVGSDQISISGYIWNKYNTQTQNTINRGIDLPQATKIFLGQPLISTQSNDIETSTVNIQGSLFQERDYAQYPFDQQHVRIILEHRDIKKNIILTPDLGGYKKISPESTPGLDKEFALSGFTIEQTFFEYHKVDPNANFGVKEYGKVTDHFQLVYNVIINRNLLNPFVLYLLPLLVILFSLFSTLLVTGRKVEPLAILGGYTGLFFSLIVLQRSLREQHPAGTTLYLEYAFFFTYITLIFLIIHTILLYYYKSWENYQNNSIYLVRILFWPFQLVSWLLTTLTVFY